MGIVNRTMDASEQKDVLTYAFNGTSGVVAVGTTLMGSPIPSVGVIDRIAVTCQGASVSPTSSIVINRFIAGSGYTAIAGIGASFTLPAIGVSGALSVSLVAPGNTLLQVLPGDCISMIMGVNSAHTPAMTVVIKKTQDVVSRFGSED